MPDADSAVDYLLSLPRADTKRFLSAVMKGKVDHFLDQWVPWWIEETNSGEKLGDIGGGGGFVEEICSDRNGKEQSPITRVPKMSENIPPFTDLFPRGKSPSPSLFHNLVDIVFSYAWASRRNFGDLNENPIRSVRDVFSVSIVLSQNFVFQSISDVFRHKEALPIISKGEVAVTIGDCKRIFHLKRFTVASLSDLHRAFLKIREERERGKREKKEKERRGEERSESEGEREEERGEEESLTVEERRLFAQGEKKTLFFLSLSHSLTPEKYQSLSTELMAIQGIYEESWKRERERKERERERGGRKEKKILIPMKK